MKLLCLLITLLLAACGGAESEGDGQSFVIQPSSENNLEYQLEEGGITNKIISLSFISGITGELNYASFNIDAVAKSDYLPTTGTLTVSTGNTYTIDVEIYADERVEGDEKLGIKLASTSDDFTSELIITIINDDFPAYRVTPVDTTEGNVGTQLAKVTIDLIESTVDPYSLTLKTLQNEAIGYGLAGSDYTILEQEFTFLEGELSKEVNIEIFGDLAIEPDELIEFVISHKGIDSSAYSFLIRSDDFPGQGAPTFVVNNNRALAITENDTSQVFQMPFSIDDSGGFSEPLTLFYFLREVDATDAGVTDVAELDQDFSLNKTAINISPGQADYIAEFSVIDDANLENVEIFELVLANEAGVEFGSGRIYISDNESPSFKIYRKYSDSSGNLITSNDLEYLESSHGIGEHKIIVELLGEAGYDFEFEYILRLANAGEVISAVDADDWEQAVNGSVVQSNRLTIEKGSSLPGGADADGIGFTINSDLLVEGNESFFIELKNINGTSIGEAREVLVLNDDLPEIKWVNENISLPATNAEPFKFNEGDDLDLVFKLIGATGLGDAALETFDLTIIRQDSNTPVCSWRNTSDLINAELAVDNEPNQVFTKAASSVAVGLHSIEDSQVECDESISLGVVLSSKNPGVSHTTQDDIVVTVVNDDVARLDVYGFSGSESLTSKDFTLSLNTDIELDVELLLDYAGAESADANLVFNSSVLTVGSGIKIPHHFDESSSQRNQVITTNFIHDDIVELDESYQLSVYLKSVSNPLPIELRQCVVGNIPECVVITNQTLPAIVLGTIRNDDKAILSLVAKGSEVTSEASLTALALLDDVVAFPYEIQLDKAIANDVPAISLSLSDRCLLASSDDCASADDYSLSATQIHDGINATSAGSFDVQFKLLLDDLVVEPSEIAKLTLSLDNAAGLTDIVDSWSDEAIDFSITDDDKLSLTLVDTGLGATVAASYVEGADSASLALGYGISWDKDIAENVPPISIQLAEACDELLNDLCIATSQNLNVIAGDINSAANLVIHDSTGQTVKNLSGLNFDMEITGDDVVEPNELADFVVTLNDSITINPYLVSSVWSNKNINFSIVNDDKLNISTSQIAMSIAEGDVGDDTNAGILINWDKSIGSNVEDINLSLSEQCDNTGNTHCVSDSLGQDIQISNVTYTIHQKNIVAPNTSAASGQDAGVLITGDTLIEPNEDASLLFTLQNSLSLNQYLITPWVDQVINLAIDNDDVLVPQLAFVDDADIAQGEEDTDKDLSPGNDVGLKLTWGSAVIADNTDDLILEVRDSCSNCGIANTDYTIASGDTNLISLAAGAQKDLEFKIVADSMVEPNEVVSIELLKKASTPTHYFSSIPAANKFSDLSYTIKNDERIRVDVVRSDGVTNSLLSESQENPLSFSWLGHAASNLPSLSIDHIEECDNDNGDNTLQKCIGQSTSLNNSPADISLLASTEIKTTGSEQDATSIAITGNVGLSQNNDAWVEADEVLNLKFSIPASLQDFLRFDVVGSNDSNPVFENIKDYRLVSDDVLQVSFGSASSSEAVSDESAEASITYSLGFDKSVEQDVGSLELNFIDSSTPGQRYADRSLSFTTATDYRVFFDGALAENIVSNTIVVKPLGESLIASSKDLIITVGDDDLVEADEVVAFSLSENNSALALFDSGLELAQNIASTERSFTILLEDQLSPGIRFSAGLVSTEITSQAETDVDQNIAAIVTGLSAIDSNIGMLSLTASINCKAVVPMTCSNVEASINATTNLDPVSINGSSIVDLGFVITGDQIIEPDEEVTISLSAPNNSEYFNFPSSASRDYTILNDDFLSIALTNSSTPIIEGDLSGVANTIDLTIADEGAGIEGLASIDYAIVKNTISGQDNAEETGDVKDFDFLGSPGSRSIDLASMQAPLNNTIVHSLATINLDHHIEADELFDMTATLTLSNHYLAPLTSTILNQQYTISDDDYLTVVMNGLTAQDEDNEILEVLVCDKQGGKVEAGFDLDLTTHVALVDSSNNEYLPSAIQAILNDDFTKTAELISIASSEVSNSNTYLTNHCALKSIPINFITDTDLEANEWLGFTLSSSVSYLCDDASNNCLQQNLVIVNDEAQSILDTGVASCITSTGTTEVITSGVCSGLSIQDVEVDYPENKYTYLDSSGMPVLSQKPLTEEIPPASYDCLEDNYSGLLWNIARLPFDGAHSTDGKSWAGSIIANSSIFEGLFSANGFCGYEVASEKWQIPSVEQLLGTVNYEELETDGVFSQGIFVNEELSTESIYWTKDSCDTDSNSSTLEYWTVNMKIGAVTCEDDTNQYLIRAVFY
jgi:hypothetical protein